MKSIVSLMLVCSLALASAACADDAAAARKEVIAILGTGDMGDSFGPRLAALGYRIIYGSRTPDSDRVRALIEATGNGASAATSDVAAREADIVFLAIPWGPMESVIESLGPLTGKTIVDLSWPANEVAEDGYFEMTTKPSGAEVIQGWLPEAMVVKAFGTAGSGAIDDPSLAGGLITIPIASDHREAKEVTARLAAELGFDPVDAGPLRMARNIEAMMELYMVPFVQGREATWEFHFRRSNYWTCNPYSGGEAVAGGLSEEQIAELAEMPETHPSLGPCPE